MDRISVKKTVTHIAMAAMISTQGIPAGYAGRQTLLTNEQGQRVYSIDVDEVKNTDPIPAYEAQGSHEAFFTEGALSAATPEEAEEAREPDAAKGDFWHDVHTDGLKKILAITEEDIQSLTVTQAELDKIHAACDGPGCARSYDLSLNLKDGRKFEVSAVIRRILFGLSVFQILQVRKI